MTEFKFKEMLREGLDQIKPQKVKQYDKYGLLKEEALYTYITNFYVKIMDDVMKMLRKKHKYPLEKIKSYTRINAGFVYAQFETTDSSDIYNTISINIMESGPTRSEPILVVIDIFGGAKGGNKIELEFGNTDNRKLIVNGIVDNILNHII